MTRKTNITDNTDDDDSPLQALLAESPSDFDGSDDPLSDDTIDLNPTPSTELLLSELELHIRARSTLLKTAATPPAASSSPTP